MIVFLCLQAVDFAFGYMAAAMYFMISFAVAGLRVATRAKLGITGDMISDACACCFAFPWAIGQMAAEDFDRKDLSLDPVLGAVPEIEGDTEEHSSDNKLAI